MKKKDLIAGGIIIGCILGALVLLVVLIAIGVSSSRSFSGGSVKDKIGFVEIRDVIYNPSPVLEHLAELEDNKKIKGILVRLDSPGGSPAGSQEIYQALVRLKSKGKILVVSMGNVAASGAYYIACAADTIMANPASITGSIGVRTQVLNTGELMKKIGVQTSTVKSGKYKDLGNPMRQLTPEEKKLLQQVSDDIYEQFVSVVQEARGLARDQVTGIADGRIMTGRQALEYGLIDTLGNLDDAIKLVADKCGIEGRPGLVKARKKPRFMDFIQEYTEQALQKILVEKYRFLYIQ